MKKQEIARENIFSSVGRVTVAVYLKADTDSPGNGKRGAERIER